MTLSKTLHKQGYDLILGSIRNQDTLQLWLKKGANKIDLYKDSIVEIFHSDSSLIPITNNVLSVNALESETFDFSMGIGLVQNIIAPLKLANTDFKNKINCGKKVTISYNNSYTKEFTFGDIEEFIVAAETKDISSAVMAHLNKNDIVVITGIIYAKSLNVTIETDASENSDVVASLNEIGEGKVKFNSDSSSNISMNANSDEYFPIAVKAHRIVFNNDKFKKLILVTDNRNFF
ncbi:hypothetical protein [Maribellus sediminis]|uniref:hypothetical protein n=1 Tax=Maribellus sediminis TaxID=2696285 RepID=UPI0014303C1A|nr:hypothetical protein [Maribellus sediminis]